MVIASCQRAKVNISLYTTGIMRNGGVPEPISEKAVAFLAEKGVKMVFSLHGASARIHDRVTRVRGSFEATVTAIARVIGAGIDAEIHVVPNAMNFYDLVPIAKLAHSLKIDRVSWLRFVPQGRGLHNKPVLELGRGQLEALSVKKLESERACPGLAIRMGAPFNILCPEAPAPCEAGTSILTISPDGEVSPCDALKCFRICDDFGSILNHSLSEVWLKSSILNAVRALQKSTPKYPCAACSSRLKCNSGCLAQKAITAGELSGGLDPECLIYGTENARGQVETIAIC